jgi:hypothetical protein
LDPDSGLAKTGQTARKVSAIVMIPVGLQIQHHFHTVDPDPTVQFFFGVLDLIEDAS